MAGWLVALVLALPLVPGVQGGDDERKTLEELLARARAEREALYARLREEVAKVVTQIEAEPLPAPRSRRTALVEEVAELGRDCAPLLVAWIDPGPSPVDPERFRSTVVAAALEGMDTGAITTDLLAMLETGSALGKRHALDVLQKSREHERVVPALLHFFETAEGELREATLHALIELPGDDHELLTRVLAGSDPALIDMALAALTATKSESALVQLRELLGQPARAAKHAAGLLAYFQAVPAAVREAEIVAFLRLADQGQVPADTRIALIDALCAFDPEPSAAIRKALEPIVTGPNRKVVEAGLVMLTVMGDRNARKELLAAHDSNVQLNDTWAPAYARRADVLRRIRAYDEAIKDYKRALELARGDQAAKAEYYVGLARSYAKKGKLRDARDALQAAPITLQQLRALAADPDFQELREHKTYGKVFPDER
jgi:tetratricopeptide (TPR) repeat protein